MKVLQVINSLSIGGAEKLVANSLPLLQKNEVSIDLLTLSNKRTLDGHVRRFHRTFISKIGLSNRFPCPEKGCNRTFNSKNGLTSHVKLSHVYPLYQQWKKE